LEFGADRLIRFHTLTKVVNSQSFGWETIGFMENQLFKDEN
jgi:hypothetical protein